MADIVNVGTAPNAGDGDPLRNAFVKLNTRIQQIAALLNNRGDWTTSTAYSAASRDWVVYGGQAYIAAVDHLSGVFADDLAAGKWFAADVAQLSMELANSDPAKGSQLVGFSQSGTGWVGRTVLNKLRETQVSVMDFGAVLGGDLAAPLTRAIAELKVRGGGKVHIPPSTVEWKLSATVVVDVGDIKIAGAGHGGNHDTGSGTVASTQIRWTGASGGDMFRFAPVAGALRRIQGNALTGVYLLANGAARGVAWLSACNGTIDIAGSEFNTAMLDMNVVSGLSEARDCQHNIVSLYGRQVLAFGVILRIDGDLVGNTSFNVFQMIAGQYRNSPAMLLRSSDNNTFVCTHLVQASGGTAQAGVYLGASPSVVACGNNLFIDLSPGTAGVAAEGSAPGLNPSILNRILYYDTGNAPARPIVGTGASLFWESNTAAPGKRRQGQIAAPDGRHFWEESDGRIVVYGLTQAVAAGASVTILSPYTFGVGPDYINVSVNSASASTTCKAAWNGAGVVITNTGSVSADFWYRFEGY